MRTVQCGDPELLSALARLGGEKWIASNYLDDDITWGVLSGEIVSWHAQVTGRMPSLLHCSTLTPTS